MSMAAAFRRLALALPSAVESAHRGATDFRLNGRIFATLAYAGKGLGTLKLTPEQQAHFLGESADCFSAAPGGWGRMGMTLVRLDAPEMVLAGALQTAYNTIAKKQGEPPSTATKAAARRRRHTACLPPPRLQ